MVSRDTFTLDWRFPIGASLSSGHEDVREPVRRSRQPAEGVGDAIHAVVVARAGGVGEEAAQDLAHGLVVAAGGGEMADIFTCAIFRIKIMKVYQKMYLRKNRGEVFLRNNYLTQYARRVLCECDRYGPQRRVPRVQVRVVLGLHGDLLVDVAPRGVQVELVDGVAGGTERESVEIDEIVRITPRRD